MQGNECGARHWASQVFTNDHHKTQWQQSAYVQYVCDHVVLTTACERTSEHVPAERGDL